MKSLAHVVVLVGFLPAEASTAQAPSRLAGGTRVVLIPASIPSD